MKQGFVEINNIPTGITTFGPWIDESIMSKEIILCIPGNPGSSGYYHVFLETIHKKQGLPVWIIGHTGHEEAVDKNINKKIPPLKGNEKLYDTEAQIEYKAEFIRKYIPRDMKVHMIGHSIGTYMILQLLKKEEIRTKIISSSMLFPTIYNLAGTPLGVFCNFLVKPILSVVIFISWLFSIFPYFLAAFCVYTYFYIIFVPTKYIREIIPVTIDMIKPSIITKVFHLGFSEIDTVQEIDTDIINLNKEKLKFYYGTTDWWAPVSHCKKLLTVCPKVDAKLCEKGYNHAFVLKYSIEIGEMVSEWITDWRKQGKY